MQASTIVSFRPAQDNGAMSDETPIEQEIRDFLSGDSNGVALFEALYGDVAEEPVPAHLLAIVRAKPAVVEHTRSAEIVSLASLRAARNENLNQKTVQKTA